MKIGEGSQKGLLFYFLSFGECWQSNTYNQTCITGLLCCSQTVQKIGNIEFPQHSGKEEWMGPLYKWIGFYTDEVKDFLDRLADVEDEQGNHNKYLLYNVCSIRVITRHQTGKIQQKINQTPS